MHKPDPLGRYPLTLRNQTIQNYKNGELLIDYGTYDLYYVDTVTGTKSSIAEIIYQKLIELRAQNTKIEIAEWDKQYPAPTYPWPALADRTFNHFYYVVHDRTNYTPESGETVAILV